MHPVRRDGEFVYVLWPHGKPLAGGIMAAVREAEGLTVVMPRADADSLGLPYDFVGAWITLEVHSSLEAVGLTAAVGAALTEAKISCNVLAGFHHDHLLVPVADADRALEVLHELALHEWNRTAAGSTPPRRSGCAPNSRRTAPPSWLLPPRPLPSPR